MLTAAGKETPAMAVLEVAINEKFDNTATQLRKVRQAYDELKLQLNKLTDSRQKSLALTKLDEVWLWAFDSLGIVDIG
jgi:hypothetical protein